MTYKYHYTGDQIVKLPTHAIITKANDKEKVYETSEPINHPDFEQLTTPQEQQPEEKQSENISHEEEPLLQ